MAGLGAAPLGKAGYGSWQGEVGQDLARHGTARQGLWQGTARQGKAGRG